MDNGHLAQKHVEVDNDIALEPSKLMLVTEGKNALDQSQKLEIAISKAV